MVWVLAVAGCSGDGGGLAPAPGGGDPPDVADDRPGGDAGPEGDAAPEGAPDTGCPGGCGDVGPAPPGCGGGPACEPPGACVDGRCAAPCARDADCDDPRSMPGFGVYRGTTRGAPDQIGARCGLGAEAPEVALQFQLDRDATACLGTMGSTFDAVLHVRTDCADRASEVACRGDGFQRDPFQARIDIDALAGVRYFVFVDGFDGAAGDHVLSFVDGPCPEEAPPPECDSDDDCGASEVCRNDSCLPR